MPVDAAMIEHVRTMTAALPDDGELAPLTDIPEVLAYLIAVARREGRDEVHDVELAVRAVELPPATVRRAQAVLRPLGYVAVADMLRKIAGRRKHGLAPLR